MRDQILSCKNIDPDHVLLKQHREAMNECTDQGLAKEFDDLMQATKRRQGS